MTPNTITDTILETVSRARALASTTALHRVTSTTRTTLSTGDDAEKRDPGESTHVSPAWLVSENRVRTDGGADNYDSEDSQATPVGKRERSDSERTSTQSPTRKREYDPYAPICEYCGLPIDHDKQRCPALDQGRCRP